MFHYYPTWGNPWSGRAEKSASAKRRESEALKEFATIRLEAEASLLIEKERIILLAVLFDSSSSFANLPKVVIDNVLGYNRPANFPYKVRQPAAVNAVVAQDASGISGGLITTDTEKNTRAVTMAALRKPQRVGRRSINTVSYKNDDEDSYASEDHDAKLPGRALVGAPAAADRATSNTISNRFLSANQMTSLLSAKAGTKHTIQLLQPSQHLTGPCWRDFSRHVRGFAGWNVKRVAATPEEKKKCNDKRKGKVYFVNLIFTVGSGSDSGEKKADAAGEKKKRDDGNVSKPTSVKQAKFDDGAPGSTTMPVYRPSTS